MNLVNLNAEEINKAILANHRSASTSLQTMRHEKFLSFITVTKKIFGEGFKLSVPVEPEQLTRAIIQTTGEVSGVIAMTVSSCFGVKGLSFMFDDDLGFWLLMRSHDQDQKELGRDIILTQMLSEILEFEINFPAFKIIEILNKLREP